jgi:hypothetical protein
MGSTGGNGHGTMPPVWPNAIRSVCASSSEGKEVGNG